jgi:hypothetical protein
MVTVSAPGSSGQVGSGPGSSGHGGVGAGAGAVAGSGSSPSPTATPDGCTLQVDPSYQPPADSDPHSGQSGAWYLETCPFATDGAQGMGTTATHVVWLPGPPPTTPVLPAPAVLAAEAQRELRLSTPVIESSPSPGHPQLVGVPMWTWIPAEAYVAASATASVPGESVTATATPASVTWSFGDGISMVCAGPGTPYTAGSNPSAASPTCGHTYTQSSADGTDTLTATISWTVTWAGGGQTGAFDDMTTTASEPVRVEQSQALVTGG